MYLDGSVRLTDTNPTMKFTFTGVSRLCMSLCDSYLIISGTTFDRYWQIRVDQIPCGKTYTPPTGCMQWLVENSGNVKSFNYGINDADYHHLDSQDYAICFRRAAGHCMIAYIPANEGESFYLSFTPSTPAIKSRAGESGCPADFLIIPGGQNVLEGDGTCQVRFLTKIGKWQTRRIVILFLAA